MKNIIFINGYNNYYNRRVKYSQNLNDYIDGYDCFIKSNINFNPNDGTNARLTANLDIDINDESPDYALLVDDLNNIVSRWFVIEMIRNLNGQYNVILKRDVVADHFDKLKSMPVFVQKANLRADNDLIYNSEGMQFNQIKKDEILLKDETQTNWIVGYIGNDAIATDTEVTSIGYEADNITTLESLDINFTDPTRPYTGGKLSYTSKYEFKTKIGARYDMIDWGWISFDSQVKNRTLGVAYENQSWTGGYDTNISASVTSDSVYSTVYAKPDYQLMLNSWGYGIRSNAFAVLSGLEEHLKGVGRVAATEEEYKAVADLNGKIVYSTLTDKYYRLTLGSTSSRSYTDSIDGLNINDTRLWYAMSAAVDQVINVMPQGDTIDKRGPDTQHAYFVTYDLSTVEIHLSEEPGPSQHKITLTSAHYQLEDAPYSMFAMPYSEENMDLAVNIVKELTDSKVFDIQLLPYCPCRYLLNSEGGLDITEANQGKAWNPIVIADSETQEQVGYLLWARRSSDNFVINQPITVNLNTALEIKLANECDMYRLCSPNYNGVFEFSVAKNKGVDFFNVSFTYKPYSPYIHVAPNFKGLYGDDFGDARGLICNGDFSISMMNDAWEQYEVNNKNFQNIFNTQIKTMDENNKLNLISQSITTPLQAAATGTTVGALGGGLGGGMVAGALSWAGGVADIGIGQAMYQNNRQAQIDLFNYNLQNIRARPDTLTKISAYNINNKYFPFVEYYSCTDVEKDALKNKIKYEGMTVMAIGKIEDYLEELTNDYNYFKGQLIQCGDISEDYHIVDALAVELERGIYLPGGNN